MLDLSGNKIQFIDGATFVDIPDLEIFKCNHCQLFQVIILYRLRVESSLLTNFQNLSILIGLNSEISFDISQ